LTFNFGKLEPFTMRLLVRQTLRAAMFGCAMAGFVLSASAAHAHTHKRGGDWRGDDRDWHGDRNWSGDRDWRWRGGAFLGAPAPFYAAPPVVYGVPPPAYYYSPYGY
jgi:hypothetical protein